MKDMEKTNGLEALPPLDFPSLSPTPILQPSLNKYDIRLYPKPFTLLVDDKQKLLIYCGGRQGELNPTVYKCRGLHGMLPKVLRKQGNVVRGHFKNYIL